MEAVRTWMCVIGVDLLHGMRELTNTHHQHPLPLWEQNENMQTMAERVGTQYKNVDVDWHQCSMKLASMTLIVNNYDKSHSPHQLTRCHNLILADLMVNILKYTLFNMILSKCRRVLCFHSYTSVFTFDKKIWLIKFMLELDKLILRFTRGRTAKKKNKNKNPQTNKQ